MRKLTQKIFDGQSNFWRFAAVDPDGDVWLYREEPKIDKGDNRWSSSNKVPVLVAGNYDATDWRNSIVRNEAAK